MTIAVAANVVTLAPIPLLKFGLVTCTPPPPRHSCVYRKLSSYDDFGFGSPQYLKSIFIVLQNGHDRFSYRLSKSGLRFWGQSGRTRAFRRWTGKSPSEARILRRRYRRA